MMMVDEKECPKLSPSAEGQTVIRRRVPFAVPRFCGYHMGYSGKPLSIEKRAEIPAELHLNWFRKDLMENPSGQEMV
jgi:GTP-dependent phosphoenolpyruvate carboxykinase